MFRLAATDIFRGKQLRLEESQGNYKLTLLVVKMLVIYNDFIKKNPHCENELV